MHVYARNWGQGWNFGLDVVCSVLYNTLIVLVTMLDLVIKFGGQLMLWVDGPMIPVSIAKLGAFVKMVGRGGGVALVQRGQFCGSGN